MKLHLPKMLCVALLAAVCGSAWAGSASTAYTIIDGTTYNGGVYTHSATSGDFSGGTRTAEVTSTDGSIVAGSTAAWQIFASNQDPAWGHTLHATQTANLNTNFSPFTLGGLIVDEDTTFTIGRTSGNGTQVELNGNGSVNMNIKGDTVLQGTSLLVQQNGQWNIATGKTLTLKGTSASGVQFSADKNVTVNGGGTLAINANTTTLNSGAKLTVSEGATLNLSGTVNAIANASEVLPTGGNGYSTVNASVDIIDGTGTVNAGTVTWKINNIAASYDETTGTLNQSGESTKYYVIQNADLSTRLDSKTTDVTIQDNATLNITGNTSGSAGMIKGNVLVKSGGTLQLSANDALGWSGGDHVSTLTVESGAEVVINHSGNETFGGTLNLNGTLTGVAGSQWDMYNNSTLNVGANAQATISVEQIRLRRTDTVFTMGANSTLDISSKIIKGNEQNSGALAVNGSGTLNLTGGGNFTTLTIRKGGDTNISGESVTLTNFYVGGGTTNISTTMNAGQVRLDENGAATVQIKDGGVLNVTGTNNDHSTSASLMLNHWGHTATMVLDGGTLNAEGAEMRLSWDGTGTFKAMAGTANLLGINAWAHAGGQFRGSFLLGSENEGSAKVIIGANGLGDFAGSTVLQLGGGTLGASADWSLRYNDAYAEAKAQFISTTEAGTIIDTTKYGTEDEGATITFQNGTTGAGNMTLTGCGSLVLNGASDRTGKTTIESGTLVVNEATALGTGAVSVADGTLEINAADTTISTLSTTEDSNLTIGAATTVTNAAELAVNALTMKEGATLSIGQHEDSIVSVQTLTVEGAATLNANLEIAAAATLHLDGTLTMGCDVELGEGITLEGNLLASLLDGSTGSITLFTGVDALTLGGVDYSHPLYGYEVFSNPELTNTPDTKYVVSYNGSDVKLTVIPEPATATLSLLALAALAARRRRH